MVVFDLIIFFNIYLCGWFKSCNKICNLDEPQKLKKILKSIKHWLAIKRASHEDTTAYLLNGYYFYARICPLLNFFLNIFSWLFHDPPSMWVVSPTETAFVYVIIHLFKHEGIRCWNIRTSAAGNNNRAAHKAVFFLFEHCNLFVPISLLDKVIQSRLTL